jgi:non-heme chloroperoxidase
MDTYADDLATLIEKLDLKNPIHVGHSTGGGEVTRYLGRHGTRNVAKVVLISAVPPIVVKTESNPGGIPIDVFDQIRAGILNDHSQYFMDFSVPFYSLNRPDVKVSQGIKDLFWLQCMMGGLKNVYDCVKAFSETDFTEDLKRIDIPTLLMHGDDDQVVPIATSSILSAKIVNRSTLKCIRDFLTGCAQLTRT